MAHWSRKIASRFSVVLTLAVYLWPEGSRAQGGFGVHPLGSALEVSSGFQLLGEPVARDSRHLQMVPRSVRSGGNLGSQSGYSLHDSPALSLYEKGQISLEDALKRMVRDSVGPLLGIKAHAPDGNGAILLSFQAAGVKLCFFGVRGAAIFGRELMLQGQIPDVIDWTTPASLDDWPDLEESTTQAVDALERTMGGPVESLGDSSRCFATDSGSLKPAWHLTMAVRGYQYSVYTDGDRIFAVEPEFFHASGRARVYPYDAVTTPTLATETLTDLNEVGTLSSLYFRTIVSAGRPQASSSRFDYLYDVTSPEFEETSVYVNVTKHFKFLQGLGFTWYGPRPLQVNPSLASIPNNARFLTPRGSGGLPSIEIGPGSEGVLRNLATDAGVVSHELGHFAIYRAVTKTSGESFVLHEALSDYFEAARAEDPCLGNSVCPMESGACIVRGKCLRTADNSFRYKDDTWQDFLSSSGQYTHLHGQIFSGLLWDLRKVAKSGAKAIDTLVMRAIGFLPPEAGFSDFLTQLVITDKEINQGAHRDQILQAVAARDLGSFLKLDASGNPIVMVEKDSGQTGSETAPTAGDTPRRTRKSQGCGIIGVRGNAPETAETVRLVLFMIILPISIVFLYNYYFLNKKY